MEFLEKAEVSKRSSVQSVRDDNSCDSDVSSTSSEDSSDDTIQPLSALSAFRSLPAASSKLASDSAPFQTTADSQADEAKPERNCGPDYMRLRSRDHFQDHVIHIEPIKSDHGPDLMHRSRDHVRDHLTQNESIERDHGPDVLLRPRDHFQSHVTKIEPIKSGYPGITATPSKRLIVFNRERPKSMDANAAMIKDWVALRLKELERQNELLRRQNQRCEAQVERLKASVMECSSARMWQGAFVSRGGGGAPKVSSSNNAAGAIQPISVNSNLLSTSCCYHGAITNSSAFSFDVDCKRGSDDSGTTSDLNGSSICAEDNELCLIEWPQISDQRQQSSNFSRNTKPSSSVTNTPQKASQINGASVLIQTSTLPPRPKAPKPAKDIPLHSQNGISAHFQQPPSGKPPKPESQIRRLSRSINDIFSVRKHFANPPKGISDFSNVSNPPRIGTTQVSYNPNYFCADELPSCFVKNSHVTSSLREPPKVSAYAVVGIRKPPPAPSLSQVDQAAFNCLAAMHPSARSPARTCRNGSFQNGLASPQLSPSIRNGSHQNSSGTPQLSPTIRNCGSSIMPDSRPPSTLPTPPGSAFRKPIPIPRASKDHGQSPRKDSGSDSAAENGILGPCLDYLARKSDKQNGNVSPSKAKSGQSAGISSKNEGYHYKSPLHKTSPDFDEDSLCNYINSQSYCSSGDYEDYVNVEIFCSAKSSYDADESDHENGGFGDATIETSLYRKKKQANGELHQRADGGLDGSANKRNEQLCPLPPKHKLPSWESRIYDVAQNCLSTTTEPKIRQSIFSVYESFGKKTNSKASSSSSSNEAAMECFKPILGSAQTGRQDNTANALANISIPVFATYQGKIAKLKANNAPTKSPDNLAAKAEGGGQTDSSTDPESGCHCNSGSSKDRFSGSSGGGKPPIGPSRTKTQASPNHASSTGHVSYSQINKRQNGTPVLSPRKNCGQRNQPVSQSISAEIVSDEEDYAIPPDARETVHAAGDKYGSLLQLAEGDSEDAEMAGPSLRCLSNDGGRFADAILSDEKMGGAEKSGYLMTAATSRTKSLKRRWFVLSKRELSIFKSPNDVEKKPLIQLPISCVTNVTKCEGACGSPAFELMTSKANYRLTAESAQVTEDWIKVLQRVIRTNLGIKLSEQPALLECAVKGWVTRIKCGHSKRYWCALIDKSIVFFKSPSETIPIAQTSLHGATAEEVSRSSDDSGSDDGTGELSLKSLNTGPSIAGGPKEFAVSIHCQDGTSSDPIYLVLDTKEQRDMWLYHLNQTVLGEKAPGTAFEKHLRLLMSVNGCPQSRLWFDPLLSGCEPVLNEPLTFAANEKCRKEALSLYKTCYLFSTIVLQSGVVDYHMMLAQNTLGDVMESRDLVLQSELYAQLLRLCCSLSDKPTALQPWHLLCLSLSLFVPDAYPIRWLLEMVLARFALKTPPTPKLGKSPAAAAGDIGSDEVAKYARYCQKVLQRTLANGPRRFRPSRMETTALLSRRPYEHSMPYSIPVGFADNSYKVVEFDGSSTAAECLAAVCRAAGLRHSGESGFWLFCDDAQIEGLDHPLAPGDKLCDVISKWESGIMQNRTGKFPVNRLIRISCRKRFSWKMNEFGETFKEKLFLCYQANKDQVATLRLPLSQEMCTELAVLMAQIHFGDYERDNTAVLSQVLSKFFPAALVPQHTSDESKLRTVLASKWSELRGIPAEDCARAYLTALRRWPLFGAHMFDASMRWRQGESIRIAVNEVGVHLLTADSMELIISYAYECIQTFGGCRDDFMLVISRQAGSDEEPCKERLIFALRKTEILQLTMIIADYIKYRRQFQTLRTPRHAIVVCAKQQAASVVGSVKSSPRSPRKPPSCPK